MSSGLGRATMWAKGSLEAPWAPSEDFGGPLCLPFAGNGLADIAARACQLAPHIEKQVHSLSLRVQKLERSRGQISKDIQDMLTETRELQRRISIERGKVTALPVVSESLFFLDVPAESRRNSVRFKTAPPSSLPRVVEEPVLLRSQSTDKIEKGEKSEGPIRMPPGLRLALPDCLRVQVKGKAVRVEWRIDNVKAKFRDSIVRPLVSAQFQAAGLPELRLMVFPNLGSDIGGLTMREQKLRYEARITEPLSGAVKFKVVTSGVDKLIVKFRLSVGSVWEGPLEHDFAEHIIHGIDFNCNWLDQMSNGSLTVGVELIEVAGEAAAAAEGNDLRRVDADGSDWDEMNREIHECLEECAGRP